MKKAIVVVVALTYKGTVFLFKSANKYTHMYIGPWNYLGQKNLPSIN